MFRILTRFPFQMRKTGVSDTGRRDGTKELWEIKTENNSKKAALIGALVKIKMPINTHYVYISDWK